ncbi:MAG: tRNA (adenosine(37)-N6)-threonylcarbamoyltransferase complex dimerization subunit type 1 TsaB [Sphingobacteriales bacterium]|nr:MAG: tRNA (adenosine(37)-N6)-threonylcarbamoyltransferase complex dimerization subunit type 1 TsaB [Sphingobacteriales bacterium]
MAAILFIDTCTSTGLIAFFSSGKDPVVQLLPDAQRFAEQLHIAINQLLQQNGKQLSDLDAVAVVSGPGSYTGLRVGLSAAKGLCFALDRPLYAFNRLILLEEQFRKHTLISGTAAVLIPARKEEWFVVATDDQQNLLLPPQHLTEADWQQWSASNEDQLTVAVASDGEKPAEGWVSEALYFDNRLDPIALASFVWKAYQAKKEVDLISIGPDYLKNAYVTS